MTAKRIASLPRRQRPSSDRVVQVRGWGWALLGGPAQTTLLTLPAFPALAPSPRYTAALPALKIAQPATTSTICALPDAALQRQFDKELGDSVQRLREAIAPYTRFVRVEREKLERLETDLQEAQTEVRSLHAMTESLAPPPKPEA